MPRSNGAAVEDAARLKAELPGELAAGENLKPVNRNEALLRGGVGGDPGRAEPLWVNHRHKPAACAGEKITTLGGAGQ